MARYLALIFFTALTLASPVPAPAVTASPEANLDKRATSCTFTAASAVSASKKSCATIVLDNIEVPAGETLDLTKLTSGTHVSAVAISLIPQADALVRSSSKEQPLSATKNGMAPSSLFPAHQSLSPAPQTISSTATARAGGTAKAPTVASPNQNSSKPGP